MEGNRFVALEVPVSAKEQLAVVRNWLTDTFPDQKFIAIDNWHVTVEFIGPTDCDDDIDDAMDEAVKSSDIREPFQVMIESLDYFPRKDGVILNASLALPAPLELIHGELHEVLKHRGFELQPRPFKPHITLGRKIPETVAQAAQHANILDPFFMEVSGLTLMKTVPIKAGVRYERIAFSSFNLVV